ncbi:MAG: flagellar biosynthesis protein FlgA [Desulfobacterales bacterium PC51MH44]|nr:MAG: flagellar biosynthesis protein FlgA [Desulfobacterales bacterium PC51MH44]
MNLYTMLEQRDEAGSPVKVGLIGAGKFGAMFLAQAQRTKGLQVVGIADLSEERARDALIRTGWPENSMKRASTAATINDTAAHGIVGLTENSMELIAADVDVIIESTGIVEAGVPHALAAIDAGRHIIMVNVETDCCVGPILYEKARKNNVVYSMAFGDQPALVCQLFDWARTCGFEVVAAGKGTKYLPEYHWSTPDTVWDYYGFTKEQVDGGDFNPKMFNSFLDGTKSAIEMTAIANATGLKPQADGLHFPPVGCGRLQEVLIPEADGGILSHSGTVEVVSSLNRDGTEIADDLRWGVYVTLKAGNEYVADCFEQYGVKTDATGKYAAMYRPSHLIGLELGFSVASAALRHEPTGTSQQFLGDVGATAKKDLDPGERLDGEGGYTVFGKLIQARESLERGVLPLGLASGITIKKRVPKGSLVTYNDIEIPQGNTAWTLRKEMERAFAGPALE